MLSFKAANQQDQVYIAVLRHFNKPRTTERYTTEQLVKPAPNLPIIQTFLRHSNVYQPASLFRQVLTSSLPTGWHRR